MKTKFELSQEEVAAAVTVFVQKAQRNKNIQVRGVRTTEGGAVEIDAEVVVPPKKPRAKKDGATTAKKKSA
jgi:hypothetical protein